jgi:hypothetical protein
MEGRGDTRLDLAEGSVDLGGIRHGDDNREPRMVTPTFVPISKALRGSHPPTQGPPFW